MRAMIIVVQSVHRFCLTGTTSRIVLRTLIMLANTTGTLPVIVRKGIGKGSLVLAMIIMVYGVPIFMPTELMFGAMLINKLDEIELNYC